MTKSIVLLSGGLDSTVNLYQAVRETKVVLCLTFDYGQKAAKNEIAYARKHCRRLNIDHKILRLDFLRELSRSALTQKKLLVPQPSSLDKLSITKKTAQKVWVANRNGLFINVAAVFAESMGASWIITGFNREEAKTFPDNSKQFIREINGALKYSTQNKVKVKSFTIDLVKNEIVKKGHKLGIDMKEIWACYLGGKSPCLRCESCQRLGKALERGSL